MTHILFAKPHKIEAATYVGSHSGYRGAAYCVKCRRVLQPTIGGKGAPWRHTNDRVPDY